MLPFMYSGMFRLASTVTFPSFDKDACHNNKGGKKGNMHRHKTECVTLISSFSLNKHRPDNPDRGEETILYMSVPFKLQFFFFLPPAMFCLTEANLKQLPNEKWTV